LRKSKNRTALLIINKKSGQTAINRKQISEILRGHNIKLIPGEPDVPSAIPGYIRHNASRADLIIIGGGDGTLSLSLSALLEADLPVGIIPLGTANDLARTLDIPMETESACRVIAQGETKPIDVGSVDGQYFLNVAQIGLGARIKKYLSEEDKDQLGLLGYVPSFYHAFQSNYPFSATVTVDGEVHSIEAIHISIGNGRHYGGGLTIAEDAAIDDHYLDVFTLGPQSMLELGALAYNIRTGKFKNLERVRQFRGKQVTVETVHPLQVTADGEDLTRTPSTFKLLPHCLEVIVP